MAIDSTRTDIKVCSNALTLVGAPEITDFTSDENQPRGGVCSRLYGTFKKAVLARHPWKFAMKKQQLSLDEISPINQWANQFFFPGDRLANASFKLFDTDDVGALPFRNFEILGERIMTDVSELWADYVHNAAESLWPEDFVEFIEVAFAARIIIQIKGEGSRSFRNDLMIEAYGDRDPNKGTGGLYQQVKTANLIGSPVIPFGDNTLISARFGGLSQVPTGGENFIF